MLIIAVIAAIVGLCLIAFGLLADENGAAGFGALFLIAAGLFGVISCMSIVPTRNVGIVTTWGKPTGRTTGAGLQWTAPWQDVDDWDASGQTYAHLGDNCVWLTIAAQRRACIPVQIEWSARAELAPKNWAAYKEVGGHSRYETWVSRHVDPQMNAAMTSTFAAFDPLGTVNAGTGDTAAPDLNKTYQKPLLQALDTALGEDITVKSIAFGAPQYDGPTTTAIAAYGQKVLEARNLQIDKANAVTRNEIVEQVAKVNQVARCLSIAEQNDKEPGLCMAGSVALTRPVG